MTSLSLTRTWEIIFHTLWSNTTKASSKSKTKPHRQQSPLTPSSSNCQARHSSARDNSKKLQAKSTQNPWKPRFPRTQPQPTRVLRSCLTTTSIPRTSSLTAKRCSMLYFPKASCSKVLFFFNVDRYLRDLNEDESRIEQRRGSGGDF